MDNAKKLLFTYRFQVQVNNQKLGFRSVSGLRLSAAFEPLAVGGMNSGPVLLPIPVKDTGKLTFEIGVIPSSSLKDFVPGACIGKEMQIDILNEQGNPGVSYFVASPVVESIELSKLDAMDSSVLVQTFTILHCGIKTR